MRRSRSRRRSFGRRKRTTQWVVSPSGYATYTNQITRQGALFVELVGSTGPTGYDPPSMSRYTIERVQGDIEPECLNIQDTSQATFLHCGIIVAKASANPNWPLPGSQTWGAAEWMWLKHYRFTGNNAVGSTFSTGYTQESVHGPNVITHSRRVIHEDEILLFIAQVQDFIGGTNPSIWSIGISLRTLISKAV